MKRLSDEIYDFDRSYDRTYGVIHFEFFTKFMILVEGMTEALVGQKLLLYKSRY